MLRRLSGFVMIVNTLIPPLLIAGLVFGGWYVYQKTRAPLHNISLTLDRMNADMNVTLDRTGRVFNTLTEPLTAVKNRVVTASNYISAIPVKLPNLNMPNINLNILPVIERLDEYPWFNLEMKPVSVPLPEISGPEIPGLQETKSAFFTMFGVVDTLASLMDVVVNVNALNQDFVNLAVEMGQLKLAVQQIFSGFWQVIKWATLFLLGWMILGYFLWTARRLKTGFAMLFNKPPGFYSGA